MKTEPYKIELKDRAKPHAVHAQGRKVKDELENVESKGIISKVKKATDWVANMVVVPKPNGEVRICVDYFHLNEAIKRKRLRVPSGNEV